MIDLEDKWQREYYVYSMLFAILNSTLNPIFYGLTNPHYQHGYMHVLSLISCHRINSKYLQTSEQKSTSRNDKSEKRARTNLKLETIEINVIQTVE